MPTFWEQVLGKPITVLTKPTWKPRYVRDYTCIWDDTATSGNRYACFYVNTLNAWYYVTITAIP
jgi:hypothetical protein